jgi:hypothetical protein
MTARAGLTPADRAKDELFGPLWVLDTHERNQPVFEFIDALYERGYEIVQVKSI